MMEDKAVEEIRNRRKKLINEEYHGSVEELTTALKELEKKHLHKVTDLSRMKRLRKTC